MPRSKSSVPKKARIKKVLKQAKGYRGKRKNLFSIANQSVVRSGMFAFAGRKKKKGEYRTIWNVRISAGLEALGHNYSSFIHALKTAKVELNRKTLAYLASEDPEAFKAVVESVAGSFAKTKTA